MKAFDNLEIWWVTGAQLLYGGDAVVAVDGHSKEMVDGLNSSGIIPIKVVYKSFKTQKLEVISFLVGCLILIGFCVAKAILNKHIEFALFSGTACILWYVTLNILLAIAKKN